MLRKTSVTHLAVACVLLVVGGSYGTGNGDFCVHLANDITGPDTALIGFETTLEIWIANDDLLGGMSPAIEITFEGSLVWDMDYGSHPPVNEEGRAVGVWDLPDLQIAHDFDNVSPEHLLIGGAAMPGGGLPAGPSEVCYTSKFSVPYGASPSAEGICCSVYCWPPVGCVWWTDSGGGYPPSFCGQDMFPLFPVCFAVIELPWICGDADENGIVNISDAIYILWVIFGTPPPEVTDRADVDCNEILNVSDVVYLIAYIFAGGPEPCAGCP